MNFAGAPYWSSSSYQQPCSVYVHSFFRVQAFIIIIIVILVLLAWQCQWRRATRFQAQAYSHSCHLFLNLRQLLQLPYNAPSNLWSEFIVCTCVFIVVNSVLTIVRSLYLLRMLPRHHIRSAHRFTEVNGERKKQYSLDDRKKNKRRKGEK